MSAVDYNHLRAFYNLVGTGATSLEKAQEYMVDYLNTTVKKSEDDQPAPFNANYINKLCTRLIASANADQANAIITAIEMWKNQWLEKQGIQHQAIAAPVAAARASAVPPPVAEKMPQLKPSFPNAIFFVSPFEPVRKKQKQIQMHTKQDLLKVLFLETKEFVQHIQANRDLQDSYVEWIGENKETIAHLAAQVSSGEILNKLRRLGVSFSESDGDKKNCMHHAAENNNSSVIDFLLKAGLSHLLFETDSVGYSPLHSTILNKSTNGLILMIWGTWQQLHSVTLPSGDNELHLAAEHGFLSAFSLCLLHSQFKFALTAKNDLGLTPLQIAAKEGHLGIVRLICDLGENRIGRQDREGAIQMAAEHRHPLICDFLTIGEVANAPTYEDLKASPERMLEFINLGLDINGIQNGKSMLHRAIEDDSLPLVKQMIREGGALITVSAAAKYQYEGIGGNKGLPALYFAASLGRSQIAQFLNETFYGRQSFLKSAHGHNEDPMKLADRYGFGREIRGVLTNRGWN
jgi:ankyrin repeat protein